MRMKKIHHKNILRMLIYITITNQTKQALTKSISLIFPKKVQMYVYLINVQNFKEKVDSSRRKQMLTNI